MARTRTQIYNGLVNAIVSSANAVGLVINPSLWSIYDWKRFSLNAVADGQSISEQIQDSVKEDLESRIKSAYAATAPWIQNLFLNVFESNGPNIPIPRLSTTTFFPEYANPNPSNRVVKYVSVVPGDFGNTVIKIAGAGPTMLVGYVVDAAQSFIDTFGVPGIHYKVFSKQSDKLYLQADIYYKGIFSPVIQQNVIDAIRNYLLNQSTLNFGQTENGKIDVSDLIVQIKSVTGVISVVIKKMVVREDTTSAGSGTVMIDNTSIIQKDLSTFAGYIVPETTAGYTFTDNRPSTTTPNLNFIAQ